MKKRSGTSLTESAIGACFLTKRVQTPSVVSGRRSMRRPRS
jgi:hypothetical protein